MMNVLNATELTLNMVNFMSYELHVSKLYTYTWSFILKQNGDNDGVNENDDSTAAAMWYSRRCVNKTEEDIASAFNMLTT